MPALKQGDRVRIVTRAANAEDAKSGLYYPHYAGLSGTVKHIYSEGEVSVEIDLEALPAEVRARHNSIRDQMKTKWLEGLSEEGRAKLTEREKDFRLRYIVLVSEKDLEKEKSEAKAAPPAQPESETEPVAKGADVATSAGATEEEEAPRRPTSEDLDKAEEEELMRRRRARQA